MQVEVDHLETLWPPYRGNVLLRVAGESHGRVINSKIAVVAGHAALSLKVRKRPEYRHQGSATTTKDGARSSTTAPRLSPTSTCLRLTVLLDAIPDDGPKPNSHHMEKFLMKVLGSSLYDVEGQPAASTHRGLLGEDIPEMLVVENTAKVIASSFLTLDGAGTFARQPAQGLVYACIEANGLLRLWKWGAEASGWCWTYLNRCNLCACREDPSDSRVLAAALSPEPEATRRDGYSRHRIVWEQEDGGEGAGLGLALTSAGPQPPRSVWCRRITFEAVNGGDGYAPPGAYENSAPTWKTGMEISVGFSVRLSSTGCNTVLSSRQGAWIIEGERVTFNHFQTGRLSEVILTRPMVGEGDDDDVHPRDAGNEESSGAALTDFESDPDGDSFADHDDHDDHDDYDDHDDHDDYDDHDHDDIETAGDGDESDFGDRRGNAESNSSPEEQDAKIPLPRPRPQPLYAVHDTTGDLMMFEPLPGVIRVIGLPGGGGSLTTRMQCTLEPTPSVALFAFAVRLNQAVLLGEELCSVYDLCTGRLLGSTAVARYPACYGRRRVTGARRSRNLPSTRGKRRHYAIKSRSSASDCVENHPVLWVSGTWGHIMGMLSATKILRIRPPRPESCAQAFLAPMSNGSPAPAPRILQYVKEYQRLAGGHGTSRRSLVLDLLGALARRRASAGQEQDSEGSARMMELLRHAFPADKQQETTSVPGAPNRSPLPSWLLLATLPVAQQDALRVAHARRGDPSVGAAELQLRRAIEARIASSLGSLDRVRELLRDPARSARQVSRAGVVADDEVAEELDEIAAGVDPATVLFEHTLRSWVACRRGDGGKKKQAGNVELVATRSEEDEVSSRRGMEALAGTSYDAKDSLGPMSNDGLELVFECEVAGEEEAKDIPFLKLLLDGSSEGDESVSSSAAGKSKESKGGSQIRGPGMSSAAESAFLCLHLVGNEASSLFEVACRALFRLRPQQLPRFVERLARFRSFADDMRSAEDVTDAQWGSVQGPLEEDGPVTTVDKPLESSKDDGACDNSTHSVRGRDTAKGVEDAVARSREGSPVQHTANPKSPTVFHKRGASDRSSSIDSLRTLDDADQGSRSGSRKVSGGKHNRARSADSVRSPAVAADSDDSKNANDSNASPDAETMPVPTSAQSRTTPSTPPSYFTRALVCLPPASADGPTGAQRRTRLVLLMGARMFSEAGKLLSVRAWEGSSNSDSEGGKRWKYDQESSAAWLAAIRLLGALRHAAEGDREIALRPSGASFAPGVSAPASRATQLSVPSVNDASNGSVALQYRVVFEDLLAQTILADDPDRMEMVMTHRPTELIPVAVIRMVRRAAACAVDDGAEFSPLKVSSHRVDSASSGRTLPGLRSRGQPLASSARTLKRCLLLLVSTDATGYGASSR